MRRLEYIGTTAAQGFWRNPVMSIASTFTIGLMLLLFAFFLATDRGLQAAVGVLESKVELALFLEDNARVSDVLALRARIEGDPAVSRVDYVTKDQAETSALFELISTRYERRSMIITANQPFGEWGKVFQDLDPVRHAQRDRSIESPLDAFGDASLGGLALYGGVGLYSLKTLQSLPAPVRAPPERRAILSISSMNTIPFSAASTF